MERLRTKRRPGDTKCPYCHDGFVPAERVVSCGGCSTIYHADCLREELRSCATIGCEVRPELGKTFGWSEGSASPRGPGITCCPEGAGKRGDRILVCNGCRTLVHTSCRERNGPCCPGEDTSPLLGEEPTLGSVLLPGTRAWLSLMIVVFGFFLVRLLRFDAGRGEAITWLVGIMALLTVGIVLLYRSIERRI